MERMGEELGVFCKDKGTLFPVIKQHTMKVDWGVKV